MLFRSTNTCTVVPNLLAIFVRLSPDFTVYVLAVVVASVGFLFAPVSGFYGLGVELLAFAYLRLANPRI